VESGITQPLLEYPDIHLKGLTSTWITSNRQYLHCHNLTITLTEKHVIQLKGKDNPIIMTAAHLQQYSPQQQKDINLVRLHLQVHTLADIRDPQRPNATLLHMLDGKRNPNTPISKLWPRRQPRAHQHPAATSLEALHVILIHPIHPILETKSNTHWTPLSHTSCQQTHSHPITLCHQPHSTSTTLQTPTPGLLNPSVYRWLRQKISITSDEGLSNKVGTFGWGIATNTETLYKCSGPVDGPRDTASSTWSKLCGNASALLFLTTLAKSWCKRHRCKLSWIVNSMAAMQRVLRHTRRDKQKSNQTTLTSWPSSSSAHGN
jgi:hypothetical protein